MSGANRQEWFCLVEASDQSQSPQRGPRQGEPIRRIFDNLDILGIAGGSGGEWPNG